MKALVDNSILRTQTLEFKILVPTVALPLELIL